MFPIHFKLTVSTPEELARIAAFIAGDYTATVAAAPRLDRADKVAAALGTTSEEIMKPNAILGDLKFVEQPKAEAPGKPTPAATGKDKPAPGQRTAEAAAATAAPEKTAAEPTPTAAAAAAEQPASTAADKPVAYADLQKAVLTLHKMDPQAAVPIAKSLGADTFKALPEDKWAEALRLVAEAIETRKVA